MAKAEKIESSKNNSTKIVGKINIDELVKKAQGAYGKKEVHLSSKISTGATIVRPSEDKHFVKWTDNNFWMSLTNIMGLPFGRICQISGLPDSGKSSTAAQFMKCAQDQDVLVILWDTEQKFSARRFDKKLKGDSNKLVTITDNSITRGAIAIANVITAVKEQDPNQKILVIWDSVGSSINSSEDKDDDGDESFSKQPGVSAKENGWALHKFMKLNAKYQVKETGEDTIAILLINQTYANIGAQGQKESGGNKVGYQSSLIVQLTRKKDMTRTSHGQTMKWGITSRAKVKKNHVFDGDENVAELDIVVSADGVNLASEIKSYKDLPSWKNSPDAEEPEDDYTEFEVPDDEGDE